MNIYRILDHGTTLKNAGMQGGDSHDGFIVASKDSSTDHILEIIRKYINGELYQSCLEQGLRQWPYHTAPFTIEWLCDTDDIKEEQVLLHSWSSSG